MLQSSGITLVFCLMGLTLESCILLMFGISSIHYLGACFLLILEGNSEGTFCMLSCPYSAPFNIWKMVLVCCLGKLVGEFVHEWCVCICVCLSIFLSVLVYLCLLLTFSVESRSDINAN